MNNLVPQFSTSYIVMRNCGADINLSIGVTLLMLARLVRKLYNVNVSTTSKTQRAFLFPSDMGGMVRKVASLLLEVETAMPPFLMEIKP